MSRRRAGEYFSMSFVEDLRALPNRIRPLRIGTLVGLRWLAVGGQAVGVVFVGFGLGYPLPLLQCLALILLSALLNLWLSVRFGAAHRPSATVATVLLAYDCLQLGGLLALAGGLENPFSLLLLAPVSVSATTLPQRSTFVLAALVIVLASILGVWHLPPLGPRAGDRLRPHLRHRHLGVAALRRGLVAAYTNQVAHDARQLADALAATELALSRREQLSALDGLAAAAAHELGTPLSTIALAAKEMLPDMPQGPLREDVELIISQSARCRAILSKLRNLGADGGDPFAEVRLSELLAEVARPHQFQDKVVTLTEALDWAGAGVPPQCRVALWARQSSLKMQRISPNLRSLSRRHGTALTITVTIADDGPGFPPELIARLGEPYLTTRARNPEKSEPGGLGLGIFIATTLLERTGARLQFQNATPEGAARVRIAWPRRAIAGGADEQRL